MATIWQNDISIEIMCNFYTAVTEGREKLLILNSNILKTTRRKKFELGENAF